MSEEWKCPECGMTGIEKRLRGPHVSGCRRRAAAKYEYPRGPKHPYHRAKCRGCGQVALMKVHGVGFCSNACAQTGKNNSVWKGDNAQYLALHQRIYVALGAARNRRCMCGERARDWANLTGDYADTYDYTAMCSRCHKRYDNARRSMEER